MTTARLLGSFAPHSDEWYAARVGRIGSSDIAAVLGLSPWESRFSLWYRKAGIIGDDRDNVSMEWGRRLEAVVIAKWLEDHPEFVGSSGIESGTWVNVDRDWQMANPDCRLVSFPVGYKISDQHHSLLEAKTARSADGWGESGSDEVPVYYRTQCLWQMDVFGIDSMHLAVLIGASDYREYVIQYDADEAALLRRHAEEFLASIAADERPNVDSHTATYRALRDLHPDIDDDSIELSDQTAIDYITARHALGEAEANEQRARSLVADEMGNAKKATWREWTLAGRQVRGNGTPFVVVGRNIPTPGEAGLVDEVPL